jgi:PKD repeat protein
MNNTATIPNPSHTFSGSGKYTVTLTVSGPCNAPSTITRDINVITVNVTMGSTADCQKTGGSLFVSARAPGLQLNYLWNPVQALTSLIATNPGYDSYTVTVLGMDVCAATGTGKMETDLSVLGYIFQQL